MQSFEWPAALDSDERKCLSYSYHFDSTSESLRFGVFCAITELPLASANKISMLIINNFNLPSDSSIVLNNCAYGYSMPCKLLYIYIVEHNYSIYIDGALATLIVRNERIGLPNLLYSNFTASSPTLFFNTLSNRIIYSFNTTNPIPNNGFIRITFS